jgi:large subunit ribosomal protein L4e
MKGKVLDKSGKEKATIDLPKNFSAKIREDILSKVFEAQKLAYTQSYGAKIGAGAGYSASGIVRHKRHAWKSAYGKGMSRIPRKILSRNGASFNWVGATVSNTRGGRKPHAPRSEKNLFKKINKKELLIAFNSALVGTTSSESIESKFGIKADSGFIFNGDVLNLKTKEFNKLLESLFKEAYVKTVKKKQVRAGRGKTRGRKYKSNAGLLFVIASNENMKRKGVDVVKVNELRIADLAPNGEPGRFACFSENAVKEIGETFK